MTDNSANNKRIAKNTMMLYIRMLFTMAVGLYTSRVILNALGVEDFGIYNVVGGVVAMFGFINASMSSSTSRFLTFELGKNDKARLNSVFSSAFIVHIIISSVIFLLSETIGLWFLENKLVIPEDRMAVARWVYQFSVISTVLSIIQVPYNASVISHEKMNIYSIIEILNATLKLCIAYIITIVSFDKLFYYGLSFVLATFIIFLLYFFYCRVSFEECRIKLRWSKNIIKPMLTFSGWDMYGNLSSILRTQGVNILLNIFFGPILNSASAIATQVQGAFSSFGGSVLIASRPQIIKNFANNDLESSISLMGNTIKYTTILLLIIGIPLFIETPFVLDLWLKEYPNYTIQFCRLSLIFSLIGNNAMAVISLIHATGKIKRSSIWNGTLYLLVIPITYFSFKQECSPMIPYLLNILFLMIGFVLNINYLKLYIPLFSRKEFYIKILLPCVSVAIITSFILWFVYSLIEQGWIRFIVISIISTILILILSYIIILDKNGKYYIKKRFKI